MSRVPLTILPSNYRNYRSRVTEGHLWAHASRSRIQCLGIGNAKVADRQFDPCFFPTYLVGSLHGRIIIDVGACIARLVEGSSLESLIILYWGATSCGNAVSVMWCIQNRCVYQLLLLSGLTRHE